MTPRSATAGPRARHTGGVPEGDTIHRTATRLAGALVGHELARFDAPRLGIHVGGTRDAGQARSRLGAPAVGTVIEAVEARGKYLLIRFGGGAVLETHLRMSGSWHLYRPGERWQRPPATARAVVATADWEAVCFAAPHVILHPPPPAGAAAATPAGASAAAAGSGPAHLGPDLCRAEVDVDEILRRLDTMVAPDTRLDVALLDQRLFCGVGNVYKSEVLAAAGLHPATPLGSLDTGRRRELVAIAHRLLRANLGRVDRVTVPGGLAVYGRAGRPCRRCGTPIERAATGPHHRSTYWCPTCQPAGRRHDRRHGRRFGHRFAATGPTG